MTIKKWHIIVVTKNGNFIFFKDFGDPALTNDIAKAVYVNRG